MQVMGRGAVCLPGIPCQAPMFAYPPRNLNDNAPKNTLPRKFIKLNELVEQLQVRVVYIWRILQLFTLSLHLEIQYNFIY